MSWLERRWQDRQRATQAGAARERTVRLQEAAVFGHPPEVLWALIAPAHNAARLDPQHVVRGYQVQGTPDGVGQQQAFVGHDGSISVIEVLEYVASRRAVTRTLLPAGASGHITTYDVVPAPIGCVLTLGLEVDPQSGLEWFAADQPEWRTWARSFLQQVEALLGPPQA